MSVPTGEQGGQALPACLRTTTVPISSPGLKQHCLSLLLPSSETSVNTAPQAAYPAQLPWPLSTLTLHTVYTGSLEQSTDTAYTCFPRQLSRRTLPTLLHCFPHCLHHLPCPFSTLRYHCLYWLLVYMETLSFRPLAVPVLPRLAPVATISTLYIFYPGSPRHSVTPTHDTVYISPSVVYVPF